MQQHLLIALVTAQVLVSGCQPEGAGQETSGNADAHSKEVWTFFTQF